MDKVAVKVSDSDFLVYGLSLTCRTETIEDYLKDKVRSLTVVALSSCFLKENFSSCRYYEKGVLKKEFKLPAFRIKDYACYRQPLVILVFLMYWFSLVYSLIRLKKKYDVCIAASYSFAFFAALLKKIGIFRKFIYYCTDYYIPTPRKDFNTLFIKTANLFDRFTIRGADFVWDVSGKIAEFRERIGRIKKTTYNSAIVPLGYSKHLRRSAPLLEKNRWDIGFVGSITANQGLQLLVEAMPLVLAEFPKTKAIIIGQGPFLDELKEMVSQRNLDNYFDFLGFIKDEKQMLDILSACAVGVALYSDSVENKNILCADPGKTKLYALCGLPIIATKTCSLRDEIIRNQVGKVINYDEKELKDAIIYLLTDEARLKKFRQNSFRMGESFISDNIFAEAMDKLEGILK